MNNYNKIPLTKRLSEMDIRYETYLKYSPKKQYLLDKNTTDIMKIRAFYDLDDKQEKELDRRANLYGKEIDKIYYKKSKKLRERYGPLVVLLRDDIYGIVNDQEAIQANSILVKRSIQRQLEERLKNCV